LAGHVQRVRGLGPAQRVRREAFGISLGIGRKIECIAAQVKGD